MSSAGTGAKVPVTTIDSFRGSVVSVRQSVLETGCEAFSDPRSCGNGHSLCVVLSVACPNTETLINRANTYRKIVFNWSPGTRGYAKVGINFAVEDSCSMILQRQILF